MLEALSHFADVHPVMAGFVMFFVFVVIDKGFRSFNRWTDAERDADRDYQHNRSVSREQW